MASCVVSWKFVEWVSSEEIAVPNSVQDVRRPGASATRGWVPRERAQRRLRTSWMEFLNEFPTHDTELPGAAPRRAAFRVNA